MDKVTQYIMDNWDKTIMKSKEENGYIGLPYPFIVPTIGKEFREMYYWDTYFAAEGLMLCGREKIVKNCTDNMLYMVNRFGFMFNASKFAYQNRSQPPFLSVMVKMVYDKYDDKNWLEKAYSTLKKEYNFWQTKRMTPCGLNQYSLNLSNEEVIERYNSMPVRIGYKSDDTDRRNEIIVNAMTDCESGWDFNPRMDFRQRSCACVDLNSILYMLEKNMSYFSRELKNGNEDTWIERAALRRTLMREYMFDGNAFYDYNFKDGKTTDCMSVASLYPLWVGVASKEEASSTVKNLCKLEFDYGISACEGRKREYTFQWDYPNGWAPLQLITIKALDNYGFKDDAIRIAQKYINTVSIVFEKNGDLWEKYNVVNPYENVKSEYGTPAMMGWTAGVYIWCLNYLGEL